MTTVFKPADRRGGRWRPLELAGPRTNRWWNLHYRLRGANRHLNRGLKGEVTQRHAEPVGEFTAHAGRCWFRAPITQLPVHEDTCSNRGLKGIGTIRNRSI